MPDVIEMDADGDLFITQGGMTHGPGTWTATADAGSFNPATPDEEQFTIEAGEIVFGDGARCTRVSQATLIGTYECSPGPDQVDVIEVAPDGTVRITQRGQTLEGTWALDGTSMTFVIEGRPDTFEATGRTLHECTKID